MQKALRGLEVDRNGFSGKNREFSSEELARKLSRPAPGRIFAIYDAFVQHYTVEEVARLTRIDPWFLAFLERIVQFDVAIEGKSLNDFDTAQMRQLKQMGFR